MIKKIKIKLRKGEGSGIMHDSRKDVRALMEVCNILIDKVNELVDTVNQLKGGAE